LKFVPYSKQSKPKRHLDEDEESMKEDNDNDNEDEDLSDDMSDILPGLLSNLKLFINVQKF